MSSNKKGFTLIELLIVIVIIGILAAIAIPKFGTAKEKTYLTAMKSDLRNLATAQEMYSGEWTTYATNAAALGTTYRTSPGVTLGTITVTTSGWAASATYPGGTTKSCQITVGSGTRDGEPVCDP